MNQACPVETVRLYSLWMDMIVFPITLKLMLPITHLTITGPGFTQEKFDHFTAELIPGTEHEFYLTKDGTRIEFDLFGSGKITGLSMNRQGEVIKAMKMD